MASPYCRLCLRHPPVAYVRQQTTQARRTQAGEPVWLHFLPSALPGHTIMPYDVLRARSAASSRSQRACRSASLASSCSALRLVVSGFCAACFVTRFSSISCHRCRSHSMTSSSDRSGSCKRHEKVVSVSFDRRHLRLTQEEDRRSGPVGQAPCS